MLAFYLRFKLRCMGTWAFLNEEHYLPRTQCARAFLRVVWRAQFYLGTTRLQLEHKGDSPGYTYTGIANVVPAFGFLGIPIISWLLDKQVWHCAHV